MAGRASAGDGVGADAGWEGVGESSSIGANIAAEVAASLLRAGSLLREGIVVQLEGGTFSSDSETN